MLLLPQPAMRAIAIVLIVLGVLGLAYGGVTWTRRDTVVDAGPIEITRDQRESLPIPPIAGGALLVVGVVLLMKRPR
jgi:uncharacterized membrane protein YidH (DUF202 family)